MNQEVDPGLVAMLRDELVPWLKANVPLSEEQQRRMQADPLVNRFTVVFDREGYSPELFRELVDDHRTVGCVTISLKNS